jgi:hypothetical protein
VSTYRYWGPPTFTSEVETVCIIVSVELVNGGWNKIVCYVKDIQFLCSCYNGLMKKLVLFISKYFYMMVHCECGKKTWKCSEVI